MHITVFVSSEIRENCRLLDNSVLKVFRKVSLESLKFYIFSYGYPQPHSKHGRKCQDVVPK